MTAQLLDTPEAAAAFVGQLPGPHKARLLAALLRGGGNEVRDLPAGMPTAEQNAEYERRVQAGGTPLSAEELTDWLKSATPAGD